MKEEKSAFKKSLNLVFVYVIIFLFGILTVLFMTNVLNNSVKEINSAFSLNVSK